MKKILFILAIFTIGAFAGSGGLDLSGLNDVSTQIDTTTQKTAGTLFKVVFAFFPLIALIVAPIVTWNIKKDEAKQNKDDHMSLWLWVIGSAMVGFIGGTVVVYVIGMGLLGSANGGSQALEIAQKWWQSALGAGGQ